MSVLTINAEVLITKKLWAGNEASGAPALTKTIGQPTKRQTGATTAIGLNWCKAESSLMWQSVIAAHSRVAPRGAHSHVHSRAPMPLPLLTCAHQIQLQRSFATAVPFQSKLAHTHYDVIIVGGGMVGTVLAATLGAHPMTRHLRVAMLERQAPKPFVVDSLHPHNKPPNLRVSAIRSSISFIENLSSFEYVQSCLCSSYGQQRLLAASAQLESGG